MPYKNKADRDYKHEYETYQGKPEQIKNRAKRNSARARLAKKGVVHKGDGKDVDHVIPLSKGGSNTANNQRVKSKHSNRSFKRTSSGAVK